ncbi:hypothetical protein ABZ348_10760 [Streptomyces sp. NPDC005963]|uniref:hypothetical protein n=1 Tax=Streptomyces sp. NPDC005963 TaxID=3156721 RepID=UPI0033F18CCC
MNHHCAWCDEYTGNPIAVAVEHANSGPGRTLYACPRWLPVVRERLRTAALVGLGFDLTHPQWRPGG